MFMVEEKSEESNVIHHQRFCADIVSIVSMAVNEGKDCLKYRILGSKVRIHSWGHEYVR